MARDWRSYRSVRDDQGARARSRERGRRDAGKSARRAPAAPRDAFTKMLGPRKGAPRVPARRLLRVLRGIDADRGRGRAVPELQAARGLRRRSPPALPGAGGRRAPVHEMDLRRVRRGRAEAVRADAGRQINRRRARSGGGRDRSAPRVGNHAVDGAGLGRAACTTGRPEESARRAAAAHGPVWNQQLHAIAQMQLRRRGAREFFPPTQARSRGAGGTRRPRTKL